MEEWLLFTDQCEDAECGSNDDNDLGQGRGFQEPRADALLQPPEDGALMASYSVFVVEPGAPVGKLDERTAGGVAYLTVQSTREY